MVYNFIVLEEEHTNILIDFNKISYLKIIEETHEYTIFELIYRYKASLKSIKFQMKLTKNDISKFLMKFKIFRLNEYFINTQTVEFISETKITNSNSKLKIHFTNGTYLIINKIESKKWEEWAKVRL